MGILDRNLNVKKLKKKGDVKGLIKALRYEDLDVRREAAEALEKIKAKKS